MLVSFNVRRGSGLRNGLLLDGALAPELGLLNVVVSDSPVERGQDRAGRALLFL